mmetsp:Transcript_48212/g.114649  ORF Transcript_48212/g.114649 Transcript_48212/m.114649 type:complete len:405 (+) Transcript_48212:88-1302(+)
MVSILYLQFFVCFLGQALPLLPKPPCALHAGTFQSDQGAVANEAALVQLPFKRQHSLDVSEVSEDDAMIEKIVYIKTFKTGSSTLTSILHWFCENHDRRCFIRPEYLPEMGVGSGPLLRPQLKKIVAEQAGTLDVWAEHARLETDLFDELIPGNFKISLFREPLSRVMSSFRHCLPPCDNERSMHRVQRVLEALKNDTIPDDCGPTSMKMSEFVPIERFHALDFILLTEKYDLGLMMLKRVLGWSMRDMLYRRMKSEHEEDLTELVDELQTFVNGSGTPAADEWFSRCSGENDTLVYGLARKAFEHQWNSFTVEEQMEINADLEMFQVTQAALEDCCETHSGDALCQHMLIDHAEWTILAREIVDDDGIVHFDGGAGSACMQVIDAALSRNAIVSQSLARERLP